MTMASTSSSEDCLRNWQLFLVGLLLFTSPVLKAETTMAPTSSGAGTSATAPPATTITTTTATTATSATTVTSSATSSGAATMTSATTATTTSTTAAAVTTTPAMVTTMSPVSTTPASAATSMSSTTATTGAMSTSSGAPSMSMSTSAAVSSSATTNSSMTTMGNTTGWSNGTTSWKNSSMSMISCRSFMCNYSDCYSMYMSQNASMCPPGYDCCELMKLTDMCYQVGCSASCSMRCNGTSQTNCSVDCCNSTNCLNYTFMSMMMMMTTTTPMMTTTSRATTRTTTTTTTAASTTPAGKKCHRGQCNGTDCYKNFNTHQVCSATQPHCQLKKESIGSSVQWTAGCTTNCSGQTPCKEKTTPPCFLECCNATLSSSCLFMNGTMNYPSSATRGPQLLTSVLVVFVISLML